MQKENTKKVLHRPVLKNEVCELLQIDKYAPLNIQAHLIDATIGFGGHAIEFIKHGWHILGIDADDETLKNTRRKLEKIHTDQACPPHLLRKVGQYKLVCGNFKDIDEIAQQQRIYNVNAILFDLGVSSVQLTSRERGFSFREEEAFLDMRINPKIQNVTGADILNALNTSQLVEMFSIAVPGADARKIAKEVVVQRELKKIVKVGDFNQIIDRCIRGKKKLHKATLPFLALRIAVNSELENLHIALPKAFDLLASGGRLGVISFHSGEDRLVKDYFKLSESTGRGRMITHGPVLPKSNEIEVNPRARSAKLRVIEKA